MTDQRIAYICDRQKCPRCLPECKHTTDIRHAYLFKLQDGTDDTWFEEPTIDVMPVRHAKWIPKIKKIGGIDWPSGMKCSGCGEDALNAEGIDFLTDFCPHCGAKMEEDNVE